MSISRDQARQILTAQQFAVWDYHVRGGLSIRATARTLELSPSTVRGHLDAAWLRIRRHQRNEAA